MPTSSIRSAVSRELRLQKNQNQKIKIKIVYSVRQQYMLDSHNYNKIQIQIRQQKHKNIVKGIPGLTISNGNLTCDGHGHRQTDRQTQGHSQYPRQHSVTRVKILLIKEISQ